MIGHRCGTIDDVASLDACDRTGDTLLECDALTKAELEVLDRRPAIVSLSLASGRLTTFPGPPPT